MKEVRQKFLEAFSGKSYGLKGEFVTLLLELWRSIYTAITPS